jgi:formate dehydrogenase alpha subunit
VDERLVQSICPYCGVGCGFYISTTDGRITGHEYMREHPVNQGALCPKGNAALDLVYHTDRLLFPLKRDGMGLHRVTWDDALDTVSKILSEIRDRYGPDAIGFLASAKSTNEENYLFQKLARMLGTNNVDQCARLSHAPTMAGLSASFGLGVMTNPIVDLAKADCIFVIGSNFAENHPIVSRWVLDAHERGAVIIVADPRFTPTAWSADIHLPVLPGSDISLINAMINVIINENLWKREFVEAQAEGFEQLRKVVDKYPPERVEKVTGVKAEDIARAARAYASAPASSIVYAMGITQHTSGTEAVKNLANLAILCGQIGRPGTGVNPLRGQDNVQGACDMGALPNVYPDYQPVTDPSVREKFAAAWQIDAKKLSPKIGLTLMEMIQAAEEGKLHAMLICGENPLVGNPNAARVKAALKKLDFLAVIDIFPSETTELAQVILPAASFAEKFGTKTATDRRVQWLERAVEPVGEARADWQIIVELARRLGFGFAFEYEDEEDILTEIRSLAPSYTGVTLKRIRAHPGGIPWPCWSEENGGTPILYTDGFKLPGGKGRMFPVDYIPPSEPTSDEYPLLLTSGRVVMHYNTGQMTRRVPSLSTREPELFVQLNPETAERFGIGNQDRVQVVTRRGEASARARLTATIPPGVLFMPFHFPGTNQLTNDALDPVAGIPEFKVAAARIIPEEVTVEKGGGHA